MKDEILGVHSERRKDIKKKKTQEKLSKQSSESLLFRSFYGKTKEAREGSVQKLRGIE